MMISKSTIDNVVFNNYSHWIWLESDGSGNDHHLACREPDPKDRFNRITRVRLPLLGESFERPESVIHRCVKGKIRNHQSDSSHVLIVLTKYSSRISQGIVKEITLDARLARKDSPVLAHFSRALHRNDERYDCSMFDIIMYSINLRSWRNQNLLIRPVTIWSKKSINPNW